MKLLRGFVLTLTLLGLGLAAHATTVAATVVDSDSTAWANGACSALYAPIPNYSGPLYNTLTGAQITVNPVSCTLNSSGVMSVTLVPSANVYGTNYNLGPSPGVIFTVCSAATGNKCYSTAAVSISGSSQDVSTQINAVIQAPRITALLPLAQAYNDTEAPLVTGAANQYFRLSDGTRRCSANGGAWGPCNGGATTSAALTMDNSGSGAASGTIFDGSVARTISYNTIGAFPTTSGTLTGNLIVQPTSGTSTIQLFGQGSYAAKYVQLNELSGYAQITANEELNITNSGGIIQILSGQELYLDGAGGGYGTQIGTQHSNEPVGIGSASSTTTIGGPLQLSAALNPLAARKGTFTCTAAGTITISNTNEAVTSDVIISLNTAGGTISTPPAMKTVTASTGFTVLCGAADASVYNYDILN